MVKKKYREIDLYDFTRFFGLDFFKFSSKFFNIGNKTTSLHLFCKFFDENYSLFVLQFRNKKQNYLAYDGHSEQNFSKS